MSSQMGALLASGLDELRYEPIAKRIRAVLGGGTAVDSTRAVLVPARRPDSGRVHRSGLPRLRRLV
jgi:hypothetical protein